MGDMGQAAGDDAGDHKSVGFPHDSLHFRVFLIDGYHELGAVRADRFIFGHREGNLCLAAWITTFARVVVHLGMGPKLLVGIFDPFISLPHACPAPCLTLPPSVHQATRFPWERW